MDNRASSNCCSAVPTPIGEKGVASNATIASSSAASKSALTPPLSLKLFARDNRRLKTCCKEDTLAAEGFANTMGMIAVNSLISLRRSSILLFTLVGLQSSSFFEAPLNLNGFLCFMLKYLLLILPTVEVTGGSSPRFADIHNIFTEAKRVNKQAKMIVKGLYIKYT
ncbi:hypothetical protein D3C74_157640 [compost metagenome]